MVKSFYYEALGVGVLNCYHVFFRCYHLVSTLKIQVFFLLSVLILKIFLTDVIGDNKQFLTLEETTPRLPRSASLR